jgi:hypothetical protein
METKYVLIGSIVSLIVYTLFNAFLRDARKTRPDNQLVYGLAIRIASASILVAGILIAYEALQASPEQRILAFVIATLLLGSSICFALETFLTRLTYDSAYVYTFSVWRGRRRIPYSAITGFEFFSQAFYEHVFRTDGFGRLRISVFLKGSDRFVKLLQERVSTTKVGASRGAD